MARKQNDTEALAPIAEVRRLLALRRAELQDATVALADAEKAMDVDAATEATQRIETLRRFIRTLEVREADAMEEEGRARAKTWLAAHAKRMAAARDELAVRQQTVADSLDALCDDIAAEAAVRKGAEAAVLAAQVLAARFALPFDRDVAALPPSDKDYAEPVMAAFDAMRPSSIARRGLTVAHRASADVEEARRDTLRTVHQWVGAHGEMLPSEVQRILAEAPIPDNVLPAPKVQEPSAHEQREAARMFGVKQAMDRALRAERGPLAGARGL
jgi:hypothetical protein